MKPREQRRNVLIKARMRSGACWGDVSILNISRRGLLIHSTQAPAPGSYLEVRRGRHEIIARVVWAREGRFGVSTQDALNIDAIVREPDLSVLQARQPQEDAQPVERRDETSRARAARERHERSRMLDRASEFAFIGAAGLSAALAGYQLLSESLGRPLTQVTAALAPR